MNCREELGLLLVRLVIDARKGADVDWYIKADDIVLKGKINQMVTNNILPKNK